MSALATYTAQPYTSEVFSTGQKNVTTAGTRVALVSSATPTIQVLIQAKRTNTGRIYVGGSTVTNDDTTGIYLNAGDGIVIETTDVSKLYINSTVNGEGVTFVYWRVN